MSISSSQRRLRILMLVAQDPFLDPRLHWAASELSREHDVTVVGHDGRKKPRVLSDYKVLRVPAERSNFLALLLFFSYMTEIVSRSYRKSAWAKMLLASVYSTLAGGMSTVFRSFFSSDFRDALRLYLQVPATIRNFVLYAHDLTNCVDKNNLSFDVIHCNDLDTLLAGRLLALRSGAILTFDAHEYFPRQNPRLPEREAVIFEQLQFCLLENVRQTWTVSPGIADLFVRTHGKMDIDIVPNAEPSNAFADVKPLDRDIPAEVHGKTRFLYLGGFAPGRGIDTIIEFWSRLSNKNAVLLLRGPENLYRKAYEKLAQDLGVLGKTVFFLPSVSESELVAAARAVDVGVIPYEPASENNRYCCPNKLSQYMQAGLPILATDLSYLHSVIDAAGCGLLYEPKDFSSFATAVERLTQDEQLRSEMSAKGVKYAADVFNWQIVSRPMTSFYRGLRSSRV